MANSQESAIVLVTMENQVEVLRNACVRRLISTQHQHTLVVLDESNQVVLYLLDTEVFEQNLRFIESDPDHASGEMSRDRIAKAVFAAVMAGQTFHVLDKKTMPSPFVAVA